MRGIRRKALQVTAHALSLTMLFGSFAPAPVYAEAMAAAGSSGGITEVAVDNPAYGRTTVLEVDGKPFWYNGMQVRIDKLREDPDYMVSDETLGKLFQQVADDGFTVVNSQIRWTDVQPNHVAVSSESAYVYGGDGADYAYKNSGGLKIQYDAMDESRQSLGYVKFRLEDMTQDQIDGAKIRFYNRNTLGQKRKLEVYALADDSWSMDTITWNNAPGHDGYKMKSDSTKLLTDSEDWDWIQGKNYYDFNISDYIKNDDWAQDRTVSFIIREASGDQNNPAVPITLGDVDDESIEGIDARPQLIYSDADEFDFSYLDQAIDFAKDAGLKLEVLWFGTDTCTISCDNRVPVHVQMNYQKTMKQEADGSRTPLFSKSGAASITGIYNYLMCKNDMNLRELEARAVKTVFDHIAERGDHVVIGCQVSNESGVGRLHGSKKIERCMCDTCTAKYKVLGVTNADFREITLWEYNNNIAKAVKTSGYPVWTRVNLDESADVKAVPYNEKMRNSAQGTYIDFIGIDHYRKTPAQLSAVGILGNQFAQGKNLPMIMELGQKDARDQGVFLEQDVLAALSGGAYVNIYDASSNDGSKTYEYDKNSETFRPFDEYVPNLFKTNHMLKKIGYDLAVRAPGKAGGNQLMYFNAKSDASGYYTQAEMLGTNKSIIFETEQNGVGIAVNKAENEFALLNTRGDTFIIENLADAEAVQTAELGYYDENNTWNKESDLDRSNITVRGGMVSIAVPAYECLRVVVDQAKLGPVEEKLEIRIEAESNASVQEGLVSEVWNDGASAGGWLKVYAQNPGDYVTINAEVPSSGVYKIETCYRSGKDRATVQLSVDGNNVGEPFDMYASGASFKKMSSGEIALSEGLHTFTYTMTGKNANGTGTIIPLDYLHLTKAKSIVVKTELETLYQKYKEIEQGNYTDDTWNKLSEALEKAKELLESGTAAQDEVNNQIKILNEAYEGLLINTDKTKEELAEDLKILIDEADALLQDTEATYTEGDIAALKQAMGEAVTLIGLVDDPAESPEVFATCVEKMRNAIETMKQNALRVTVLMEETFDSQTEPENFGFDKGASIGEGVLTITHDMNNSEISVKKFSSEISNQASVGLSFDWVSGQNGAKGKTGIDFRDSYGRLIAAFCASTDEKTGALRLRSSAAGTAAESSAFSSTCEPSWSEAQITPGNRYHMELWADFREKTVSVVVSDEDGKTIARIDEAKTEAGGLAQMIACNYWTMDSKGNRYPGDQRMDNFKIYTTEAGVELPLKGKKIIAFGDSIIAGHKYKKGGFVEFTADKEGMTVEENYAHNGAKIMPNGDSSDQLVILNQVLAADADDRNPDYIIFDGGTNDAYDTILDKLGTADDTEPDTDTFAGAFRSTIMAMKENWPDAEVIYVAVHKLGARDRAVQEKLHELELAICRDMGITVANLYDDTQLDTSDDAMKDKYSFDTLINGLPASGKTATGTHPNFLAIEEFYVPLVSEALKQAGEAGVEKEQLDALILEAESKAARTDYYTAESIDKLQQAVEAAKRIAEDKYATQNQVNEQIKVLQKAIDALEVIDVVYYTTHIEVAKKPARLIYEIGEDFDPSGMKVVAYEKASPSNAEAPERRRELEEDEYEILHEAFDEAGIRKITVVYESEFTCSFEVKVMEATEERYTTRIEVVKKPIRLVYETGEDFEPDGMQVCRYEKASPSNAVIETMLSEDEYDVEHEDFHTAGSKNVTVTYYGEGKDGEEREFTDSFTVKVIQKTEESYTTRIKVTQKPKKLSYRTGEAFDPSGLEVTAYEKASPSNAILERMLAEGEYEVEHDSFDTAGTKKIRISYEAEWKNGETKVFRDSFTVKVTGRPDSSSSGSGSGSSNYVSDSTVYGSWQGGNGIPWKFQKTDGSCIINEWARIKGLWYHFDSEGNMQTGWLQDQNKWYLLNDDGIMYENVWLLIEGKWYFLNPDGSLKCSEWFLHNGEWYYLNADGTMLTDGMSPDGYRVDREGHWIH